MGRVVAHSHAIQPHRPERDTIPLVHLVRSKSLLVVPNSGNVYPSSKPISRICYTYFPNFVQNMVYPKLFPIFKY